MNTVYITDNGVMLKRVSQRIALKKDGKIIREIPISDLKRVLVFGNNQVSTDLMGYLSSRGIELAFLSRSGKYKFRVVPETSKNIYLRMAQHHVYENEQLRINWARIIVRAKITNQRSFLLRCRRIHPEADLSESIDHLKNSLDKLGEKKTLNELMGAEGFASSVYFKVYGRLVHHGFEFSGRSYYPPRDPVNALLSFGYMLVFNEIYGLCEGCGFDVFLGFFHSVAYGRASLVSDIMEEFRTPIIDRMVIYLINHGVFKPEQFAETENKGIRMDDAALKTYLKNYEKYMTSLFVDMKTREQKTYRQILRENVYKFEQAVLNGTDYEPHVFYS